MPRSYTSVWLGLGLLACAARCVNTDPEPPPGMAKGGAGGVAMGVGSSPGTGGSSTVVPRVDSGGPPPSVDAAVPLERGPAAPTATSKFPFPQNRQSARCVYPAGYNNNAVRTAYAKWKADLVTSQGAGGNLRIQRTPSDTTLDPGATVSEGIGYGMIVAVYMNDQALFDGLWKYEQNWLDKNGLMDWYINAAGDTRLGMGGATDADEDMAWALIQADKQWGGKGSLSQNYVDIAKGQIQKIWDNEVFESKLARAGDLFGDWTNINISYFAPAYYRVFAQLTGDTRWNDVIKTVYDTIDNALNSSNGNLTNGLVPAWCTSEGQPTGPAGDYQYDSCRTPFRIGLDWCLFAEPRAKAYVAKTSGFFSSIGATKIADGYGLNGMATPAHPGQGSAAFVGPAGVGAMSDPMFSSFVNQTYSAVATGTLVAGGAYYEESWTVLSLLMMTGNFLDYTMY